MEVTTLLPKSSSTIHCHKAHSNRCGFRWRFAIGLPKNTAQVSLLSQESESFLKRVPTQLESLFPKYGGHELFAAIALCQTAQPASEAAIRTHSSDIVKSGGKDQSVKG